MYSNEKKALGKDALISTMLRNAIVVLLHVTLILFSHGSYIPLQMEGLHFIQPLISILIIQCTMYTHAKIRQIKRRSKVSLFFLGKSNHDKASKPLKRPKRASIVTKSQIVSQLRCKLCKISPLITFRSHLYFNRSFT